MTSPPRKAKKMENAGEPNEPILNLKELEKEEPILKPNPRRFVMRPGDYPEVMEMAEKAEASMWSVHEIDLADDLIDWNTKLNKDEKHFITHVLAFFAASDGIVNENIAKRFSTEVQVAEIRYFYDFQMAIESVHARTYSLLITTYVPDTREQNKLFDAIENFPSIKRKAEWAMKWMDSSKSFVERLIAFAAVEGIFFSGSFCAIFWLKKRGLMRGLAQSNLLISRDEGMHCDFAVLLFFMLIYRPPAAVIRGIIMDAVECEKEFITESLPVDLIGINGRSMSKYIEFVADRLMVALGQEKIYFTNNPFEWMELISFTTKTNMFEGRVTDYQKAFALYKSGNREFKTDAPF